MVTVIDAAISTVGFTVDQASSDVTIAPKAICDVPMSAAADPARRGNGATVAAEALGATRVGEFVPVEVSPEPFQVMADPEGNEFCFVHIPGSTGP